VLLAHWLTPTSGTQPHVQERWQSSLQRGNWPNIQTCRPHTSFSRSHWKHGPINETDICFLGDLGRKIAAVSNEGREVVYLFQHLSLCLQRFNAVLLHIWSLNHNFRGAGAWQTDKIGLNRSFA